MPIIRGENVNKIRGELLSLTFQANPLQNNTKLVDSKVGGLAKNNNTKKV
jgi:hypothetical protein